MKRLLTYGLLLLTILASHFVVSACQDDLPDTTEVMMTFTTRAVVSDIISSDAPDEDKMKDLRVIMLRQDGTVVDNHLEPDINASSVTFTFTTPIQTGGEDFTFLAVANEESIQSESELSWLNCNPGDNLSSTLSAIKAQQIGDGTAFDINDGPIPQTKQWTVTVPQQDTHVEKQTLDFVASKISVQFKNETNKAQSLSNIHITGITPNGKGRLFNRPTGKKDDKGEEIYEEVYVTENDVTLNNGITFNDVAGLPSGESSAIQHYYTYPVDAANISSPTLYAKWGDEVEPRKLELTGFTELKRNDHLKILITLTDVGIKVTYTIADWEENTTTIGGVNPTLGDNYMVKDWVQGDDVVIGEEPVKPDPGTGDEVTVWGDKDGEGAQEINWEKDKNLVVDLDWLAKASIVTGPRDKTGIQISGIQISGIQMYVYFTGDGGKMEIREGTTTKSYKELYINGTKTSYLDSMGSERVSIFIPNEVIDTQFNFSGINYTITKITVVK